jgi:hypothetical protein
MADKQDYWRWQNFLIRDWQPPPRVEKLKAIGFALILASFGTHGKDIYASARIVGERACVSESTAKRWRRKLAELELFRETDDYHGRVRILEIAIPDARVSTERLPSWDDCEDEPALSRPTSDTPKPAWRQRFDSGHW